MTYGIKCTKADALEPQFIEGREYPVYHNETVGYFFKDNGYDTVDIGGTPSELLNNVNGHWCSRFELFEIEPEQPINERTEIRKKFQQTLIQYNMDIGHLEGRLVGKPSNIISAQIAMSKVKREAIQELYDELFKEDN